LDFTINKRSYPSTFACGSKALGYFRQKCGQDCSKALGYFRQKCGQDFRQKCGQDCSKALGYFRQKCGQDCSKALGYFRQKCGQDSSKALGYFRQKCGTTQIYVGRHSACVYVCILKFTGLTSKDMPVRHCYLQEIVTKSQFPNPQKASRQKSWLVFAYQTCFLVYPIERPSPSSLALYSHNIERKMQCRANCAQSRKERIPRDSCLHNVYYTGGCWMLEHYLRGVDNVSVIFPLVFLYSLPLSSV